MMNPGLLIDTDILIDVSRGIATAIEFIATREQAVVVGISLITRMEILAGCRDKQEMAKAMRFLSRFQTVGIDESASQTAERLFQEYRLSHGMMIPDCLIAATAISLDIPLATRNLGDFRFIPELRLETCGDVS